MTVCVCVCMHARVRVSVLLKLYTGFNVYSRSFLLLYDFLSNNIFTISIVN